MKIKSVCIDNFIFRLHYKATLTMLLVFALFITAHQYLHDPIDCISDPPIGRHLLNEYCWTHSTYKIPETPKENIGLDNVPDPEMASSSSWPDSDKEKKYLDYYRWIGLLLFIQALLCYIPRLLWKWYEGGLMEKLVKDLNPEDLTDEDCKCTWKRSVLDAFFDNFHRRNNIYAANFFYCESLNLLNVLGQFVFMNFYLGNEFRNYGSDVLSMSACSGHDPMQKVFPITANCNLLIYGPAGNILPYNVLCVLPLNFYNGRFYAFLWFWFFFVGCLSACVCLARLVFFMGQGIRKRILQAKARLPEEAIEIIAEKCEFGDVFVLQLLGRNMERGLYRELLHDLAVRLGPFEGF